MLGQFLYFVATLALSIALSPRPKAPRAATLEDFDFPTAEEGRPIPVVFGEVDISGANVLWYGDLDIQAIKKRSGFSKSTVGYRYYIGFHNGLCHGPVDAVTRVAWDDKEVWTGSITDNASGNIDEPSLFGGEGRGGGVSGDFDIMMGGAGQSANSYLTTALGEAPPAYRGVVSFVWKGGYVGNSEFTRPVKVRVKRILEGWTGSVWYSSAADVNGGMNAAHIIYEALTNLEWGMGVSTALINDSNFRDAADELKDEGFGLHLIWNQTDSIENFVQAVLDHINGGLTVNLATGQYELTLFRSNYDPEELPVYGEDAIVEMQRFEKQGWGSTANELTLVYTDPDTRQRTSITGQDLGNVEAQGLRIPSIIELIGIRNHTLARNVLARELASRTTPLTKVAFTINRKAWNERFGSLFILNWPERECVKVFRVLKVDRGTLQDGLISIEAMEDIYQYEMDLSLDVEPIAEAPSVPNTPVSDDDNSQSVISTTVASPPLDPSDGDVYFVPTTGASGAWDGHEGEIAEWDDELGEWVFTEAPNGAVFYVEDLGVTVQVINGNLAQFGTSPTPSALAVSYNDSLTQLGVSNVQHAIEALAEITAQADTVSVAAFANGLWFGSNRNNEIYDSVDGVRWTRRSGGGGISLDSLMYAGGRYHAIRGSSVGRSDSSDPYDTWTWTDITGDDWERIQELATGELIIFRGLQFRISTDDGATWDNPTTDIVTYEQAVDADTPVAWFRLGDGASVFADESSNYVLRAGLGTGRGSATGLAGGGAALHFTPRVDLEVRTASPDAPVNVFQGTDPFSIEMWTQKFNVTPGGTIFLYAQMNLTGLSFWITLSVTYNPGTDDITLQTRSAAGGDPFAPGTVDLTLTGSTPQPLFDGNPHHIVVRREADGSAAIVVDGTTVASSGAGTVTDLTSGVASAGSKFGNVLNAAGVHWEAVLDELALYDSALSDARIAAHYAAGISQLDAFSTKYVIADTDVSPVEYRLVGEVLRPSSSTSVPFGLVPTVYETMDFTEFSLVATLSGSLATDVETRNCPLQAVAENGSGAVVVLFRHISGSVEHPARISRSLDDGESWSLLSEVAWPSDGLPPTHQDARADKHIVWDGTYWVISGRGWSARSADASSWTFSSDGSGIPEIVRLVMYPDGAGLNVAAAVSVGGPTGSYYSDDNLVWTKSDPSRPPMTVREVRWFNDSGALATPLIDIPVYVARNAVIRGVAVMTTGGAGSCEIDVRKDTVANYPPTGGDSIVSAAPPEITSGVVYVDETLTGWDTEISAGDILMVHVASTSTFTSIVVALLLEEEK